MNNSYILPNEYYDKKLILLFFYEDYQVHEKLFDILHCDDYYQIISIDLLIDIILKKEINKINNDKYLFVLILGRNSSSLSQKKIVKWLLKENINNYKLFTINEFHLLYVEYFRKYFKNKGININNKLLKINDFVFHNSLLDENNENNRYYLGDAILPLCFNDYTMVLNGPYEYAETKIKKDDVVFDCGANVGSFSAIALSKGCEVHSFEPINNTFSILKQNLNHFSSRKKFLNDFGISSCDNLVDFYIKQSHESNSYVLKDKSIYKKQFKVTSIDKYVEENKIEKVDFIKADVEGAERDLLLGAMNTLRKYKPKISICTYHFHDDPVVLEGLIKQASNDYIIRHRWKKIYAYCQI